MLIEIQIVKRPRSAEKCFKKQDEMIATQCRNLNSLLRTDVSFEHEITRPLVGRLLADQKISRVAVQSCCC